MADGESPQGTVGDTGGNSSSNSQTQTPPATPAQQINQAQQSNQDGGHQRQQPQPFYRELQQSLDALPERIVNAIREVVPQSAPVQPPTRTAQSDAQGSAQSGEGGSHTTRTKTTQTDAQTVPGKRSFAEWWFGLSPGSSKR